jgi:hypothetical protein
MVYAAVVLAHRRAGVPRLGVLGLRSGTKWANVARMSASDMRETRDKAIPGCRFAHVPLIRATLRHKPVARMSAAICGATRVP